MKCNQTYNIKHVLKHLNQLIQRNGNCQAFILTLVIYLFQIHKYGHCLNFRIAMKLCTIFIHREYTDAVLFQILCMTFVFIGFPSLSTTS